LLNSAESDTSISLRLAMFFFSLVGLRDALLDLDILGSESLKRPIPGQFS